MTPKLTKKSTPTRLRKPPFTTRSSVAKTGYLNTNGWAARGIGYLIIWSLHRPHAYFGWSRRQDEDRDPRHTLRMQRVAAPALILFALSLTFAAFDWLMSLEAAWFSTIFGVIIFAGSAVAILALTILIGLSLYNRGLVGDVPSTSSTSTTSAGSCSASSASGATFSSRSGC